MGFFKQLQTKSSTTKGQYSFAVASLITGMIGLVWVSTVPSRFAEITKEESEVVSTEGRNFGDIIGDTKDQLGNIIDWKNDALEEGNGELDPNSALGGLGAQNENEAPTEAPRNGSQVNEQNSGITIPENISPETVRGQGAGTSTSDNAEWMDTLEEGGEPLPVPKVILIGTTTSSH